MQPQNLTAITPNTLVHGRYLVTRTIGRGGMGAVYEAVDQRLGNTVALKQMLVSGANVTAAFEREARLLAGLRHPSLPRVTDHFSEDLGQFLVMEFIPGSDFGSLLSQRGRPFSTEEVLQWADQALAVLEFLHVQQPPIIHRDIKPQNVKLTPAGEIVLLDFGLAKSLSAHTTTGSIFAYTPTYAPLEQVQGVGTTPASDLYSLSATLHHLLTGTAPPDVLQRVAAKAGGQADPLRLAHELNPLVPPVVSEWLAQGLVIEASQRPPSAAAMRAGLRQILHQAPAAATRTTLLSEPAPAPAATLPPSPVAPAHRGNMLLVIGAVIVLALAGGLGAFFALRGQSPAPAQVVIAPSPLVVTATPAPATEPPPPAATTAPTAEPPPPTAEPALPASTSLPPTSAPLQATPVQIAAQPDTSEPVFGPTGPLRAQRASASGAAAPSVDAVGRSTTFDAANVTDGFPETAWRVAGDGRGQFIQLDFGRMVRVRELQVLPGYAKIDPNDGTNRFIQNRRVRRIQLEFSDGTSYEATFSDQPALQAVPLPRAVTTTYVRLIILETTAPGAVDGRDFTPLSEVVVIGEEQLR